MEFSAAGRSLYHNQEKSGVQSKPTITAPISQVFPKRQKDCRI